MFIPIFHPIHLPRLPSRPAKIPFSPCPPLAMEMTSKKNNQLSSKDRNPRHPVLGFGACLRSVIPFSFQSRGRSTFSSQAHVPILFVITMFPVSTALVVIAFFTLPFAFSWPQNLADLAQLGRELHGYSQSGPGALAHVFGVVSAATIWMHAWSIPGSVLWVCRTTLSSFCPAHHVRSQKKRMSSPALYFRPFWQRCFSPSLRRSGQF